MTTAVITWNAPGGANSVNQTIRYRLIASSTWTVFATVSAATTTTTITGLQDNMIYEFQIVDNCSVGGPTNSVSDFKVKLSCPAVTYTSTYNSLHYSFVHLGGDISKYVVNLLTADGSSILNTNTFVAPSGTITGDFVGLVGATAYQVQVIVYAGTTFTFNKSCVPTYSFTTAATPVCASPTAVVATLS